MLLDVADDELLALIRSVRDAYAAHMDAFHPHFALEEVFKLIQRANKYIDETEPWKLAKDDAKKERLATVLYNLLEGIRISAICLAPYLPDTSAKILDMIGTSKRDYLDLGKFGQLENGIHVTAKPEILFARVDLDELLKKIEEDGIYEPQKAEPEKDEKAAETEVMDVEPKAEISYEDFDKLQFQVGEILECEAVPKSKKLLKSQIRVGSRVIQVVSGIHKHYTPEEMVGKKVMVLVNLKPATLAGVKSEGMILSAEAPDGSLALLTPEKDVPAGSGIA